MIDMGNPKTWPLDLLPLARLKTCGREAHLTFRDLADAGWRVD